MKTDFLKIALDRSARRIDVDGRLHIRLSHISKANVCAYYGHEVPGYESLGLVADQVYRLFRDPVELERGAATFARLPILSEHVPVTVDAPQPDLVIGAIGSEVTFNEPYLDADLCFWDATAIAGIDTEKVKELSCAYRYVPVMESGEYNGMSFDGRMTEIQGNHLALVEVGRAGSDVVVADHNPFTEVLKMKMSKLGKAFFAAFSALSPKLAADSALPALVGGAVGKTFDKAGVKTKLMALDVELNPQQLDNIIDALLDVEQEPEVAPAAAALDADGPAEKLRALLAGKVDEDIISAACALVSPAAATDEFPDKEEEKDEDKGMKKEEVKAAMDGLRKELLAAEEARREVRPVVGDVLGMDKAADIFGFALDQMKVDHKDVEGAASLRALFRVAAAAPVVTPRIALDADAAGSQFPALKRFGVA